MADFEAQIRKGLDEVAAAQAGIGKITSPIEAARRKPKTGDDAMIDIGNATLQDVHAHTELGLDEVTAGGGGRVLSHAGGRERREDEGRRMSLPRDTMELAETDIRGHDRPAAEMLMGFDHTPRPAQRRASLEAPERSPEIAGMTRRCGSTTPGPRHPPGGARRRGAPTGCADGVRRRGAPTGCG